MMPMINTETKNIEVDNVGVAIPAYKRHNGGAGVLAQDKQPPVAIKKTALRDVQNQNGVLARSHQANFSFLGGGLNMDTVKVCGNKRLTPEHPSSSPFYPGLSNTCANEHIMNVRRRFELELGRGRIQSNVNKTSDLLQSRQLYQFQQDTQKQTQLRASTNYSVPVATVNNMIPPMTNSSAGQSAPPNILVKYDFGMQAAPTDSLKVTLESPNSIAFKGAGDEQRTERFIRLQKFLKECDESNCRDYIYMLRHQSPADLSKHAVELEKRAIQLTIEEGKEMQRMKAQNVLGKSVLTSNAMQTTQPLQPRK